MKPIQNSATHSLAVDLCLQSRIPPEVLYHGTTVKFLSSILENGIVKGQRQYVHLSQDYQTAITVGSRRGQAIVLTVDSKKMYDCGYDFFLSENGVWLCDYVSTEFISYE